MGGILRFCAAMWLITGATWSKWGAYAPIAVISRVMPMMTGSDHDGAAS
jgi:hypothetical protein